ncbi:MAG TPA: cell wall anchor protein [Actinoplanes sp.]
MIRSKTSLRRALATTAAAVLGLGGAVAISAPASAHATTIDASYECDRTTGNWLVDWTLENDFKSDATVEKLKASTATVQNITDGAVIPQRGGKEDGKLTGRQIVPGTEKSASLSFTSLWPADKYTDEGNAKTVSFEGTCVKEAAAACVSAADARFTHEFVVRGEESTARVKLNEGLSLCAGEPVTLVSYFAPQPEFSTPQYVFASETKVIDNTDRSIDLKVAVPDCHMQVDLFFGGKDDIITEITAKGARYGNKKLGTHGQPGSRSTGPGGAVNGGNKVCKQPAVEPVSACDGTLALKLSNNGKISGYPVEFTVTAGSFTKKVTVQRGEAESVTVPAGSGEATVTAEGLETKTYTWAPAADCELPGVIVESDCDTVAITVENPEGAVAATAKVVYGDQTKTVTVAAGRTGQVTFDRSDADVATIDFPGLDVEPIEATIEEQNCDDNGGGDNGGSGDNGGGGAGAGDGGQDEEPGLPVTGPAAAGIAGGAAALLVLGGVLFMLARRRRVTFTA